VVALESFYEPEALGLYRNNGKGGFDDVASSAGLVYPMIPMGSNFGDINGDGFLDFYLGIRSLPGAADTYGGALGLSLEESVIHELRFRGGGLSINATGNWLLTPTFVALGWFTAPHSKSKSTAFACLAICVIGLFATMSRSSILGFALGSLFVLPYISRLRPAQVRACARRS